MDPLFFGDSQMPLYGVYHKSGLPSPDVGVVLLSPFGQEYMRCHRALRQLSNLLSRQGVPVLRFDYRGTGDSAGDQQDFTLNDWVADASLAIEELKDTAGVKRVDLVGIRLGGLVASEVVRLGSEVGKIIFWDTVLSGKSYLQELRNEIEAHPTLRDSNFIADDGAVNFNGFELNAKMTQQLNSVDLSTLSIDSCDVVQLVSQETEQAVLLREAWKTNSNYQYHYIPAPGNWNFVDEMGGILLPQPIIQAIVSQYENKEAA